MFLWPLLNNFIPLIKEWINAKHDQAFLREVFKQANFQNALILISLMILSSAIPGVSSSIFCIFVGLLYGPLLAIPMNIIGNTFGNLTSFEILRRLEKPEKSKRMEKFLNYIENFKHRFIGISLAFSSLLYSFYTISSGQLCLCSDEFTHKDEDFGNPYWSDASLDCLCS